MMNRGLLWNTIRCTHNRKLLLQEDQFSMILLTLHINQVSTHTWRDRKDLSRRVGNSQDQSSRCPARSINTNQSWSTSRLMRKPTRMEEETQRWDHPVLLNQCLLMQGNNKHRSGRKLYRLSRFSLISFPRDAWLSNQTLEWMIMTASCLPKKRMTLSEDTRKPFKMKLSSFRMKADPTQGRYLPDVKHRRFATSTQRTRWTLQLTMLTSVPPKDQAEQMWSQSRWQNQEATAISGKDQINATTRTLNPWR